MHTEVHHMRRFSKYDKQGIEQLQQRIVARTTPNPATVPHVRDPIPEDAELEIDTTMTMTLDDE